MNELLVRVSDNLDVRKNDLVRYYTADRSKIQYGLAKSYDKYENLLTVSAQFTTDISPSVIIMSYPEEDWKNIKVHQSTEYQNATVNIYPFQEEFLYDNKTFSYTSVNDRVPYLKKLNLSFSELMDHGPELFLTNVRDIIDNVVTNEVTNENRNLVKYRGSNLITDEATYNIEMSNMEYNLLSSIAEKLPYKFTTSMNYDKFVTLDLELFLKDVEYNARQAVSYYVLNNYRGNIRDVVKVDLPYTFKFSVTTTPDRIEDGILLKECKTQINRHLGRYVMKDSIVEKTKIPLPYTFKLERHFTEMHDDPVSFIEKCRDTIYDILDNTVIQEIEDQRDELFLPYREYFTVPFNLALESGPEYCESEVLAEIRMTIDSMVPKYQCDNGLIIVKDIPYRLQERISTLEVLEMTQTDIENYVVDKVFKYLDEKVFDYEYGVMIHNGNLTMSSYLESSTIDGISEYKLKESIIHRFEELLCGINDQYWDIKTVQDSMIMPRERTADFPLVNEMEFLPSQSSSMKHVYRLYINHAGEVYRAFLILNNRRLHKSITIASPHITSQNAIVLKEVNDLDNPLLYEKNYLKFLMNDRKNEIKRLLENDRDYH